MADKGTHINYTIEDIERYLNGSMSAKEMHEIELAALKDPFLADAIEGYSETPFQTSYKHLNEINASLYKTKDEAKVIPIAVKKIRWWNAAAMVAVVVITGGLSWYLIGLNKTAEKEANPASVAENMAPLNKSADTLKLQNDTIPVIAQLKKREVVKPVDKPTVKSEKAGADNQVMYERNYDLAAIEDSEKKDSAQKEYAAKFATPQPSSRRDVKPVDDILANNNRNFIPGKQPVIVYHGRVTDNNNQPVPNAVLMAPGIKTVADNLGYFSLKSGDSIVNVTVSSIGYEATETKLESTVTNNITMIPDENTLSEVVVEGFGRKKESSKKKTDSSGSYPSVGWESFQEYVYRQLNREMDTTLSSVTVSGNVELEFTVDEHGLPVNFKVLKSLGAISDRKAIDIVKNGPKWISGKKNRKAKITIQF